MDDGLLRSQILDANYKTQNSFPYNLSAKPTLKYRPDAETHMPPTIDPQTYAPISAAVLNAHKERQEIRGRLRRHYWKLAYHPKHGVKFNELLADPMIARWDTARSVWHLEQTIQPFGPFTKRRSWMILGSIMAFTYWNWAYEPYGRNANKSVIDFVAEGKFDW